MTIQKHEVTIGFTTKQDQIQDSFKMFFGQVYKMTTVSIMPSNQICVVSGFVGVTP
jgi:hypothetical protein